MLWLHRGDYRCCHPPSLVVDNKKFDNSTTSRVLQEIYFHKKGVRCRCKELHLTRVQVPDRCPPLNTTIGERSHELQWLLNTLQVYLYTGCKNRCSRNTFHRIPCRPGNLPQQHSIAPWGTDRRAQNKAPKTQQWFAGPLHLRLCG